MSSHIHTSRLLSLGDELLLAIVIVDDEQRIRDSCPSSTNWSRKVVIIDPVEVYRYFGQPTREPHTGDVLLINLGGAAGAPTRYLIDRHIQQRYETVFPFGTFAVNVVGALLLGLLLGLSTSIGVPEQAVALLGFGFCGALTAFNTFGYETVPLLEDGFPIEAGLNTLASLLLGTLAALAGYALAGLAG
jgi:fluoride exporter